MLSSHLSQGGLTRTALQGHRAIDSIALHGCAALCCLCLLAQAVLAHGAEPLAFGEFLALNLVAIGSAAWVAIGPQRAPLSFTALIAWALAMRAVALFMTPFHEDDYFRFLWDGYLTVTTGTPYHGNPEDFFGRSDLPARMQYVLGQVGYPEVPTIYGPTLQLVYAAAAAIDAGSLHALRALLVVVDMVVAVLLARHMPMRWATLYAWNPLVVLQGVAQIHPDGVLGLLLLALALSAQQRRWYWTGLWWGLLFAAKSPVALVVAPLVCAYGRRDALARIAISATLTVIALYLPLWSGEQAEFAGLAMFAGRWQFNAGVYSLLAAGIGPLPARVVCGLSLFGIGALLAAHLLRAPEPLAPNLATAIMLCALLLLSPVLNPWYVLWWLPLVAGLRLPTAWLACAALLLAHATAGALRLSAADPFDIPVPLLWVEHTLLLIAIVLAGRRLRRTSRTLTVDGSDSNERMWPRLRSRTMASPSSSHEPGSRGAYCADARN